MTASQTIRADSSATREAFAGKYLLFGLHDERYGIHISRIREIVGNKTTTPVPRTPDHVRGIANLRGTLLTIMCLRTYFGLPRPEDTKETCILVLDTADTASEAVGLLVDRVFEVVDIDPDQIRPRSELAGHIRRDFINALAKADDHVHILLDVDTLLAESQLATDALTEAPISDTEPDD